MGQLKPLKHLLKFNTLAFFFHLCKIVAPLYPQHRGASSGEGIATPIDRAVVGAGKWSVGLAGEDSLPESGKRGSPVETGKGQRGGGKDDEV